MNTSGIIHIKAPRRGFRFLILLSLFLTLSIGVLLAAQQVHGATAVYVLNVNSLNGMWPPPSAVQNPVELAGNFSVYSGSGMEKQYGVMINWGDGTPYTIFQWADVNNSFPYITWTPNQQNADTFNGTFNTNPGGGYPDMGHIYTAEAFYNISIKLFHSQLGGTPGTVVGFSFMQHVLVPMLTVSNSAPAYAHEGDVLSYNLTVTNPSLSTPMYRDSIVDSMFGDISSNFSSLMNPQQTESRFYTYTVPSPSDSIITSNVTAIYHDAANHTTTSLSSWNLSILHPGLQIIEAGPAYAHEGDAINYTVTIFNTGDATLYNVSINDNVLGSIWLNGTLPAGQNQTFTIGFVVPSTPEINSTAIASGSDVLGRAVSDSSSWLVKVQYPISVAASPTGANGGTFNVTFTKDGTLFSNISKTTPWTDWVDSGTTVTVAGPQGFVYGGPGSRFKFEGYEPSASILMDQAANVTLSYATQFYLNVASAYDTPIPTSGWFDAGTNITASVSSPIAGLTGTQYASTGWSGSGSVPASGNSTSVVFTINAASSLTWKWKTQYYLSVTSPHATALGTGWYDSGTQAFASLDTGTLVGGWGTRYVFVQWTGAASGNGTTSEAITMNGPEAAAATWNTEYYLWLSTNPSTVTTPYQAGWYKAGTNASVSTVDLLFVDSSSRWRFMGWTSSDMNKIVDPASASTVIVMDGPILVEANYDFQFKIVFDASTNVKFDGTGAILYVDGAAKTAFNLPFTMFVNRNQSVSYGFVNPVASMFDGKHFRWDSTSGLSQTLQTNNLTITQSGTIKGDYAIQYQVIVTSAHGSPSPSAGVYWYDAGTFISASVMSPADNDGAGTRYRCTGWVGTGSVPADGYDTLVEFVVDAPSTLAWNWVAQYYLTVTSTRDAATGEGWYDVGTIVSSSVSSPSYAGIDTRYVAVGFAGTGSAPLSDMATQANFTITMPSTITWSWKTQYLVTFKQNGVDASATETVVAINGSPKSYGSLPFQEWMDMGSQVNYLYQTVVSTSQNGKRFLLQSTLGTTSPINVTMPFIITGNYRARFYLNVISSYPTPTPSSSWFDAGTFINASITSIVPDWTGIRHVSTGWTGAGSVSASGTANNVAFIINAPSNITWNWKTQYYMAFSMNYGTITPNSGWYDEGLTMTIDASVSTESWTQFQWHGWTGLGSGSYTGLNQAASVTMYGPINETSYWKAIPSLIIFVANETIARSDRIAVYGSTSPVSSAVPLEVTYTFPNGKQITHTVMTDSNGQYSDVFLLENGSPYGIFAQSGQWVISVSRALDANHEAAASYTTVGIKALDTNLFILALLAVSVTVAVIAFYLLIRKRIEDKKLKLGAWRIATLILGLSGLVFGIIALMPSWMSVNGSALLNGQTYLVSFSLNPFESGSVAIAGIKYTGTEIPALISPAWTAVPRNPGPITTLYLLPAGCALTLVSLYKPRSRKQRTIKMLMLMTAGALMLVPIVSTVIFMAVQSGVVTGASTGYAVGLFLAMVGGLLALLSSAFAAREITVDASKPTAESVPKYEEETWIKNK